METYGVFENKSWNFYVLEMAADNFYNPIHQICRVKYKGKHIDLRIMAGIDNPNPQDHLVLVIAPDRTIDYEEVSDERLDYPPGLADPNGTVANIPVGFCFLIDRRQKINTTNPQNGAAGFAISRTNMFDRDKIVAAVSPRFGDRDYTTVDDKNVDPNAGSIGLFINKDGTILLKATGGSITLGKEGVHIGGRLFHEASAIDTGFLSDNSIADLISSTVPTAGVAYPKLPNFGQIANIANAGLKFVEVTDKARAGLNFATTVGGLA